jgi:hypothetical protein
MKCVDTAGNRAYGNRYAALLEWTGLTKADKMEDTCQKRNEDFSAQELNGTMP